MSLPEKYRGRHLLFMGIRTWSAMVHNFQVPSGSQVRECKTCHEPMWVQKSFLKLIKQGAEGSTICFQCARAAGIEYDNPATMNVVPEAMPEYEQWIKTRRQ